MKFRKLISAVSAAAVSFSSLGAYAFQVSAVDDITIAVDSVTVVAGENFEVDVNLTNVPASGISGIEFAVKYDSSVISIDSVKEGSAAKTGSAEAEIDKNGDLADTGENGSYSALSYNINTSEAVIDFIWLTGLDSSYYIKKDGVFVTISGKVLENASGKAELEVIPISRGTVGGEKNSIYASIGDDAELAVPVVKNGTVTVSSNPSQETGTLPTPGVLLGDISCDGTVDIRDVTFMNQCIVGMADASSDALKNGDVITDGKIDVKDLGQLKKYIVKLITKF